MPSNTPKYVESTDTHQGDQQSTAHSDRGEAETYSPTPPDTSISQLIDQLTDAIELILNQNPAGLREYDLLKALRSQGLLTSDPADSHQDLRIFHNHFLIFHCLHRLRQQLHSSQLGSMEISALDIRILPASSDDLSTAETALQIKDSLADYYLDLSNLSNTTASDVETLLQSFWVKFAKGGHAIDEQQRQGALLELGLSDPVTAPEIKSHYRRLAMQHHPDRGGDAEVLKRINQAVSVLLG